MPGPVRTRLACDRCHSQKLRCGKEVGSPACTRCTRAGAVCTFSPPGRAQHHEHAVSLAPVEASDVNLLNNGPQVDWPFLYDGLSLDGLVELPSPHSSANDRPDGGPGQPCNTAGSTATASDSSAASKDA